MTLASVTAAAALLLTTTGPAPPPAYTTTYTEEWVHRVKLGYSEEWWDLFRRYQIPELDEL